jgi:hypothetical protein
MSSDHTHLHMSDPLDPRAAIGQAITVLMDRHRVSRDAAIAILVKRATDAHRTVRQESRLIVSTTGEYVAPEVFVRLASTSD